MKPIGNKVLVKIIKAEAKTSFGLVLQQSDEIDRAEVLAIGSKVDEVAVGEICLVNWNRATEVTPGQYLIPVTEIVMVYE